MGLKLKTGRRARNAKEARRSFVTRRAELKLDTLADIFKLASGSGKWTATERGTLTRKLKYRGFHHLESLKLVYNWENRFMAVNYNLQMVSDVSTEGADFKETGDCRFTLKCSQSAMKADKRYQWLPDQWEGSDELLEGYLERLQNPLITERLNRLDIMEGSILHREGDDYWLISLESLIGSATWLLIPPVFSMITPKLDECVKFYELFQLLGDALVNNSNEG